MKILALSAAGAAVASRCGPKAAALARLRRSGLPVPIGLVLTADAYRSHLASAGVEPAARRVLMAREDSAHRLALEVRLGLLQTPLPASVADGLAHACRDLSPDLPWLLAVRSSALHEGASSPSFAGQLETFLAVTDHADLLTGVRACWASLWSPRAVRYMLANGIDPAATAVAVLVQRLVPAVAAGGALSATHAGRIVLTAAWGLGPAVAQGEVVPDRYVLRRDGPVLEHVESGRKSRMLTCSPGGDLRWRPVTPALHSTPCLDEAQALALARLVLTAEAALDAPVEIEWALDAEGFHLLQARPAPAQATRAAGPAAVDGPCLAGQPAASGWAVGPARLVRTEAELDRVRPGDVLVTRVPGPALAAVLPRVVAVVAELGGSTSHLAALARERRIPAVLGIGDATRRIPEGARVVVDGTLGVVHVERTDSRRH
ncbi:MAG: PEP/pyruvate-binding domain-containing protein [candidate division NC10 bacterium]